MSQGTFDPSKRRLCPDGACIGVLGDDGRCRVCGRASDGSAPASMSMSMSMSDSDDLDSSEASSHGWSDDLADQVASASGGAGFRPDRPLCDDGSCIGVIGDDGRCGVCGRARSGG